MEEQPELSATTGDDLRESAPPPHTKLPWYRRWWVYALVGLVVFWFGTPYVLRVLVREPSVAELPSGGFTPRPGAAPATQPVLQDLATAGDPLRGSPVAPVTIVEFGDFQCPFCREAAPIVRQVLAKYPEAVRLVYRDFPLIEVHDQAVAAAEAAGCAEVQGKFWEYHDRLYQEQDRLGDELYLALARELGLNLGEFSRCREGHLRLYGIQADYEAGVAAGVQGTPTWFVNGIKLQGVLPLEVWDRVIIEVVRRALSQPKP